MKQISEHIRGGKECFHYVIPTDTTIHLSGCKPLALVGGESTNRTEAVCVMIHLHDATGNKTI